MNVALSEVFSCMHLTSLFALESAVSLMDVPFRISVMVSLKLSLKHLLLNLNFRVVHEKIPAAWWFFTDLLINRGLIIFKRQRTISPVHEVFLKKLVLLTGDNMNYFVKRHTLKCFVKVISDFVILSHVLSNAARNQGSCIFESNVTA